MITFIYKALCFVLVFVGLHHYGFTQPFNISNPIITTCSGVLLDSGGNSGTYSDGEDFTTVICPDSLGGGIALNWFIFNLSTSGMPNTLDQIEFWDGNSTAAPYIGLYTGNSLSGKIIACSVNNPTGCLTVRFRSNNIGTGNFAAGIGCLGAGAICDRPTAINSTILQDNVSMCMGDTLFLNGSNSIAVPGTMITEWQWTIGSSAPFVTNTPLDTLVLMESGVLVLQLQVTSNLECASAQSEPQRIIVSGPVHFLGTIAPISACVPEQVELFGCASIDPFIQNTNDGVFYENGILLPDFIWTQLNSTVNYTSGPIGHTITDIAELGDICLNIEHSGMGDFVLNLECPNGQSVMLHQQGGGGTFLGDANAMDDGIKPISGICYEYCFNANPEHGTWAECAANGITPNVTSVAYGTALAPGSYTPVTSLDSLLGCPMNGAWTLRFVDIYGGDNGFLCSWSLGFPQIYDSTYFSLSGTLDIQDTTRAFWSGNNVMSTLEPTLATATITTLGEHEYIFSVIDSYGCAFDTSVTIIGYAPPIVEAGNDVTLCVGEELLNGTVEFGILDSCNYVLSLRHQTFNGWPSDALVTVIHMNDTTSFNFTEAIATNRTIPVIHGEAIQLLYTAPTDVPNSNNGFALLDANGSMVFFSGWDPNIGLQYAAMTSCTNILPPTASIFWSPQIGINDTAVAVTSISSPAQGWYTLTGAYLHGCSVSDSVYVQDESGTMQLSWNVTDSLLCVDQSFAGTYIWRRTGYFAADTTSGPCLTSPFPGTYSVIAQPDNGCTYFSDTLVICAQIAIDQYNGNLHASITTGIFAWTFNGDTLNEFGPSLTMTAYGDYSVINTLPNGCISSASIYGVGPVGIPELVGPTPLRIIPNPTKGTFRLQLDGVGGRSCTLELHDITGRLVLTEQYSNWSDPQTIHAEHLNQGTYFVTVVSSAERFVGKLILER